MAGLKLIFSVLILTVRLQLWRYMQTKQGNKDTTIETGRIEIQIHLKMKLLQFSVFKIQSCYFKDLNLVFLKNFEQIQI